jgi:hypothetical protein
MRSCCLTFVLAFLLSIVPHAQTAAGLKWTAPKGWRTEAAQSMRAATYTAPPVPGDAARAECAIYFFGQGQGGSVDANLERWRGQFTNVRNSATKTQVARGLRTTTLDVTGTYSGMGGPTGGGAAANDYRLLGAVVEGPGGNIFVKFTGPSRTIGANQLQFEELLASFQPAR